MTPGARLSAAIEVLNDIEARRRPATDALKDWGLAHRFAGSGDRAAIGGLVFDALRRRSSAACLMGAATPRAILLGALRLERGLSLDAIVRLADAVRTVRNRGLNLFVGESSQARGHDKDAPL